MPKRSKEPKSEEANRVEALDSYNIIDTPSEEVFDEITRLSATLCNTPMVMISLVNQDRQWFKSRVGAEMTETPRDISFCQYAIHQQDVFIVEDTLEDERFSASPLVVNDPNVRFYAGAPLVTPEGYSIGTLCVMDTVPRVLSLPQVEGLKVLSEQVMAQLELKRSRSVLDLTETELRRKRLECVDAENAISSHINFFDALMESIAEGIYTIDPAGRLTYINHSAQKMLGWPEKNLLGRRIHDIVHYQIPDGTPLLWENCPLDGVLNTGVPLTSYEDAFVRQSGETFAVLCSCAPIIIDGVVNGLAVAFTDDTERKQAELERQNREHQLRSLADNVGALLSRIDTNERYVFTNQAYKDLLGLSTEHLFGKTLLEVHGVDAYEIVRDHVYRALSGDPDAFEATFMNPLLGPRLVHISYTPEFDVDGNVTGVVMAAIDTTERRKIESQLLQAQKLESIGQLAAGIAHELNTPIQYIAHNARFLEEAFEGIVQLLAAYEKVVEAARVGSVPEEMFFEVDSVQTEDLAYLISEIPAAILQSREGTERVSAIVGAMKEFAHPGTANISMVNLNRLIESSVIVSKHDWKYAAELTTELDRDLPQIEGFPGELNQVFLNIIVNAAHAVSDAVLDKKGAMGTINITTRTVHIADKDYAEIRIFDSGTGIRPEVLPRIFDPFFTTKQFGKGTGQGLAIAHGIVVEKHKGTLECESSLGVGTTFIIRLPVKRTEPQCSPYSS
jgi:PAS domain S-box-containing protein